MVRPYDSQDFQRVLEIEQACFPQPNPPDRLADELAQGRAWVEAENGIVHGFLIAKYKDRIPYVYDIAVHPDYRRNGCATALMTTFHNHFSAFDETWLQVRSDNPAELLYADMGYRIANLRWNYYGPGTLALDMYRSNPDRYKK